MSYYAVDLSNPKSLRDALLTHVSNPDSSDHWFALIDSAFDYGNRYLSWFGENVSKVYYQGRLANLAEVSPLLIMLSRDAIQLEHELMRLLLHCNGRPMLSFIRSPLSAEEIREQWQSVLEVETEDAQSFVLRFADTRVLPALSGTAELWQRVAGRIAEWQIIGRTGNLERIALPEGSNTGAASIRIPDKTLEYLLKSGEADVLASVLDEHFPEILPTNQGARVYTRLVQVASFAEEHSLAGGTEIFALAVADFSAQNQLLEHPAFVPWLSQRSWQPGQLEDALGEFLENYFMESANG